MVPKTSYLLMELKTLKDRVDLELTILSIYLHTYTHTRTFSKQDEPYYSTAPNEHTCRESLSICCSTGYIVQIYKHFSLTTIQKGLEDQLPLMLETLGKYHNRMGENHPCSRVKGLGCDMDHTLYVQTLDNLG